MGRCRGSLASQSYSPAAPVKTHFEFFVVVAACDIHVSIGHRPHLPREGGGSVAISEGEPERSLGHPPIVALTRPGRHRISLVMVTICLATATRAWVTVGPSIIYNWRASRIRGLGDLVQRALQNHSRPMDEGLSRTIDPGVRTLYILSMLGSSGDSDLECVSTGKGQPLSHLEVRFFLDAGYFVLGDELSARDLSILNCQVELDFNSGAPPVRRDSAGQVTRLSRIAERSKTYSDLLTSRFITEPLSGLLGPNVALVLNRHNHISRLSDEGKARRLHRDVLQWSRPVVTCIVYLQDATEVSTATRIVPTSQLLPYVGKPNNGGTWMDEHSLYGILPKQALSVPVRAGGILLLNGLAFHAMALASPECARTAITAAYRSVDELSKETDSDTTLARGEFVFRGDS